jgi:hypothetical protein
MVQDRFQVVTATITTDRRLPRWAHDSVVDLWTGQVYMPLLDRDGIIMALAYGPIVTFNGNPFGVADAFLDRYPNRRGPLSVTVEKIRRAAAA